MIDKCNIKFVFLPKKITICDFSQRTNILENLYLIDIFKTIHKLSKKIETKLLILLMFQDILH